VTIGGYIVGRSTNDGSQLVLIPLVDLSVIAGLLAVVDDRNRDESMVVERVFATVMHNPDPSQENR
jgi:hypothetical protein